MKHTKGPWTVEMFCERPIVIGPKRGQVVADCCFANQLVPKEEQLPNAHLIAAAPELLIELNDLVYLLETHFKPMYSPDSVMGLEIDTRLDFAKRAIAKAQGGAK